MLAEVRARQLAAIAQGAGGARETVSDPAVPNANVDEPARLHSENERLRQRIDELERRFGGDQSNPPAFAPAEVPDRLTMPETDR